MMEGLKDYITLVIHSTERAEKLREILTVHGLSVELREVEGIEEDLRGRIKEVMISRDQLVLGLKVLESSEVSAAPLSAMKIAGVSKHMLIPVDFSESSQMSVKVGFYLAQKFGVEPIVMHSYLTPVFNPVSNAMISEDVPIVEDGESEVTSMIEEEGVKRVASSQMSKFRKRIEDLQKIGDVVDIKFSTQLIEGVAEEVIHEYCREMRPLMVVMSTRGVNKKESDLVGSVTAEVIDSCRVPVFTVPENYVARGIEGMKRVLMFCTLTRFDIVTMRGLMNAFDYPSCDIHLVAATDRNLSGSKMKIEELERFLSESYPTARFHIDKPGAGKFDDRIRELLDKEKIQLIIVPNKKTSALSRFFRPTIAHRILFEKDIPLLALPI